MEPIISNKYQNKSSKELNKNIPITLEHSSRVLKKDTVNLMLSATELYKRECDSCTCYRLSGSIGIYGSNVLVSITGDSSYSTVLGIMNYDETDMEYEYQQEEVLLVENGWWYYLTGDTLSRCEKIYMEPTPDKLLTTNNSGDTNWDIYCTYPYSGNTEIEFDGVPIGDGIRINTISGVTYNNRVVLRFITAIKHGLSVGSSIRVDNLTTNVSTEYSVYKLGDENGDYPDNAFLVDVDSSPPDASMESICLKRLDAGVESQYFCRFFKKMTNLDDYLVYPASVSQTLYGDRNHMVTFDTPIDVAGVSDYLGRPLTQLYLTMVKKPLHLQPNEDFWSPVVSGIETIFQGSNYDINTITDTGIEYLNTSSELFFGDIVEWNPNSQTENVLEIAQHRFNSTNRILTGYLEGYWYQPHYGVPIKSFSDEIQETYSSDEAPSWASLIGGKYRWREIAENSSGSIPFINGCLYCWAEVNLFLKRQDPCQEFDFQLYVVSGQCEEFDDYKMPDESC